MPGAAITRPTNTHPGAHTHSKMLHTPDQRASPCGDDGRRRRHMSAPAAEKGDPEAAPAVEFVHPMVMDDEGRMITRSMRTTDTLQELMDFYYDMVPVIPFGKGVFLYQCKRVEGDRRLAMKSTDHIDFYSEMKPDVFVLLAVRELGIAGRVLIRTMRRTDRAEGSVGFLLLRSRRPCHPRAFNLSWQADYM